MSSEFPPITKLPHCDINRQDVDSGYVSPAFLYSGSGDFGFESASGKSYMSSEYPQLKGIATFQS
jgi:hypothetical protein